MQEYHRNGQDDSDIAGTSEPFTITRFAMNRRIISSAVYSKGPANQTGDHLAASLSGPEGSEKFFQELRWARKCFLQTEENVAHKKLLVVSWCPYRQYYRRKAKTIKLYGKMFTSEIDKKHVKLEIY